MHLAIVHYHLNRGGVTRVIENHLRGLAALEESERPERVIVFYGGRANAWDASLLETLPFLTQMVALPGLDYAQQWTEGPPSSSCLQDDLQAALLRSGFLPDRTVVHVHNHSLGKNVRLLEAIQQLATDGWRFLLQVHDFAEDLRPQNYRYMLEQSSSREQLQARLYPQADHIHYAVLNRNDWGIFQQAGMEPSRLHLLPNSVSRSLVPIERDQARERLYEALEVPQQRPYVIYPVRAIRRKNIGELLMYAAALENVTFAITLAPLNPEELTTYEQWLGLVDELQLPVLFDVGGSGGMTLEETYAAADATITTSVAEGFGLVYLEASLLDRPLFGRNLPGVTEDFCQTGLSFPGLSGVLAIPTSWVDIESLASTYMRLTHELRADYEMAPLQDDTVREQVAPFLMGKTIDFARLDFGSQCDVVRRVATDRNARLQLLDLNENFQRMKECLAAAGREAWQVSLARNRDIIEKHYSLHVVGGRYAQICRSVCRCQPTKPTSDARISESILQQFVKPGRLYPIRLKQ